MAPWGWAFFYGGNMVITPEEKQDGLIKIYKDAVVLAAEYLRDGYLTVDEAERSINKSLKKLRVINAKNTAL